MSWSLKGLNLSIVTLGIGPYRVLGTLICRIILFGAQKRVISGMRTAERGFLMNCSQQKHGGMHRYDPIYISN
jgi:hypothetical protein